MELYSPGIKAEWHVFFPVYELGLCRRCCFHLEISRQNGTSSCWTLGRCWVSLFVHRQFTVHSTCGTLRRSSSKGSARGIDGLTDMLSDLAVSDSMTYNSLVFSTAACTFWSCSEDKTKISQTSSSAASQRWFVLRRWTYQGDLDDESFISDISDGRPLPDEPVLNKCDQFGGVKRRLEALWNFARPVHDVHNLKMCSCTSSLGVQSMCFW